MKKTTVTALATFTLLLAGCGTNPDSAGPPILSITNSASSTNSALGTPEAASSDRMMWMGRQNFTAGVDLSSLDSDAMSYVVPPSPVSRRDFSSLRKVFALKNEFVAQDENMGGGYLSGDYNTGATPTMYVSADAMKYWSYQAPWSNSTPAVGCATPSVSPDDTVSNVLPCAIPTPPENVPTAEQAGDLFKKMLKDLGLAPTDFITESYADEWYAGVTGYLKINGVRSSLTWSASYGADAQLTSASGVLADITNGADYPRIGTTQGIARLNSNHSYGWGGPAVRGGVAYNDMAVESPSSTGTAYSDTGSASENTEDADVTEPAISDDAILMPPDTQEMPVTEIEIISVEEELVSLYGVDGSIYLVPGYAFLAAKESGWTPRYVVSALPDEFINEASNDSGVIPGGGSSDAPVPETMMSEPNDPSNPSGAMAVISQDAANTLLTKSEAAAAKTAASNGWEVRVGQRGDEMFALTKDYRQDRVTLTIISGKVTRVDIG